MERRLNAESDTMRRWLQLSCSASGKIGLVSAHLCDSGHGASPTSPRPKRGVTFGVGQRSGNSSAPNHCVHCGFHAWLCFAVVHVPWGNCVSHYPPSHEEGVALLVARMCNEVVPAHKEFLRARQTPVPCLLYTSPSPRDGLLSRMPSSA